MSSVANKKQDDWVSSNAHQGNWEQAQYLHTKQIQKGQLLNHMGICVSK